MKTSYLIVVILTFAVSGYAQTATWLKSGSNIYPDNTSLNVGIGTTAPAEKLHINGSVRGNQNGALRISTGFGYVDVGPINTTLAHFVTDRPAFYFSTALVVNGAIGSYHLSDLRLKTGTVDRVAILNANGNVGIGTVNPLKKLEVVTSSGLNTSDYVSIGHTFNTGHYSGIHFGFLEPGSSLYRKSALVFERTDNAARGKIHFLNNALENSTSATLSDSKLTIDENGNTGIGTTSPAEKLHVKDGHLVIDHTDPVIYMGTGASDMNRYLAVLNSPAAKVASGLKAGGILVSDSYSYANPEKNDLIVKGKVGIGNPLASNPNGYTLLVNGTLNATGLYVNDQLFVSSQWITSNNDIVYNGEGAVGIGTPLVSNPNNYRLAVNGKIGAKEVRVETSSAAWPDYVFSKEYNLPALKVVEDFIKANNRLMDIPSAAEVDKNGHDLGTMDALLLKKIEELTLYVIELQKEIEKLKN